MTLEAVADTKAQIHRIEMPNSKPKTQPNFGTQLLVVITSTKRHRVTGIKTDKNVVRKREKKTL